MKRRARRSGEDRGHRGREGDEGDEEERGRGGEVDSLEVEGGGGRRERRWRFGKVRCDGPVILDSRPNFFIDKCDLMADKSSVIIFDSASVPLLAPWPALRLLGALDHRQSP